MKRTGSWAVLAVLLAAGCFTAPKEVNVNVNTGDRTSTGTGPAAAPGGGSWTDLLYGAGGQMLAAEHGAVYYAFDTLAYPAQPVDLAVRLQSAKDLKGVEGAKIFFYQGDKLVGQAKTDASGLAKMSWTPPKAGTYPLEARVAEVPKEEWKEMTQCTPAPLLVAAWDKNDPMVVIDLDHTLVDSSFFRVLVGGARPMADSRDVTERLARQYRLVYLTHRPDLLTRKSKTWLSDNGYPPGPLLVSELKQAFGDSGAFKTARLRDLRKAYPNVKAGIGDKYSDAQAYVDNDLTAVLIPYYKAKPKDMREAATEIGRLNGRGKLHVVDSWQQIEQSILQGRKFPPESYVKDLQKRARQLEEEQRARDKEDDD